MFSLKQDDESNMQLTHTNPDDNPDLMLPHTMATNTYKCVTHNETTHPIPQQMLLCGIHTIETNT